MAATSNCIACAYRVQGVISIAYRCESCGEILDLNHCLQSVEFLKRTPNSAAGHFAQPQKRHDVSLFQGALQERSI